MRKIFFLLLLPAVLFSCDEESRFDPLAEPPYDKITDSIRKFPENPELYYRRGRLLFENNQPVFAARDVKKAWDLEPRESYALSMVTLLKEKGNDSTIAFIESALKKLPGNVSLQVDLAKAYHESGSPEKAMALCNEIISRYPGQLDALLLKSTLLKEASQPEAAVDVLEKAYQLAPGDVEIVHTLGFDYAETKNKKVLALADSLIAVDVEGNHAEPYYFKGIYHYNTGNNREALRYFDEAIRHNYNFIDAHMSKGVVYYDQKQYAEALKTFRLATTVSPTYAPSYFWLGKTQEAMGKKAEAKLDYQRAYGLDKNFTEARQAAEAL